MIKNISARDYKCHSSIDINLGPGVTLIVAPNGKGKTKLFEAVEWCMFGSKGLPNPQESILGSWGKAKETKVEISNVLRGDDHKFIRIYNGSASAYAFNGEEEVASTPAGVQEYLYNLGIDHDGYSMVYAKQNELAYFVHAVPSVRKSLLSSLLGLDLLYEVISENREEKKLCKEDLLQFSNVSIEDLETQVAHLELQIQAVKETYVIRDGEFQELDSQVDALRKKLSKDIETNAYQDQYREIVQELGCLEVELQETKEERDSLEKELEDLKPLDQLQIEREEMEEHLEELVTERSGIRKALAGAEANAVSIQSNLDKLDSDECPVCGADLEGPMGQEHINELQEELDKFNNEITRYREMLDSIVEESKELKEAIKLKSEEIIKLYSKLDKLDDMNTSFENYVSEIDRLSKKRVLFEAKYGFPISGERAIEIHESKREIEQKEQERRKLHSEVSDLNYKIQDLIRQKKEVEEQISEAESENQTKREIRNDMALYEKTDKALSDFRDYFISSSLDWVCSRASNLLLQSLEDSWTITCDKELNFYVNDRPLSEHSTGQIDLVCICLRIAVSEFLSRRIGFDSMLILDGVFDSIDEDNRDAIGKIVSQIPIEQVIILSHFHVPVMSDVTIEL